MRQGIMMHNEAQWRMRQIVRHNWSLVFHSNIESIQSLGRFGNSAQPLSCSGRSPFGLWHRQRAPPLDLLRRLVDGPSIIWWYLNRPFRSSTWNCGSGASPSPVLDSVSSDLMTWNRRSFQNLDKWLSELRENTDPSDAWLQLDSSNSWSLCFKVLKSIQSHHRNCSWSAKPLQVVVALVSSLGEQIRG